MNFKQSDEGGIICIESRQKNEIGVWQGRKERITRGRGIRSLEISKRK